MRSEPAFTAIDRAALAAAAEARCVSPAAIGPVQTSLESLGLTVAVLELQAEGLTAQIAGLEARVRDLEACRYE